MKIGQYLAKIWTKYDSLLFWGHPYRGARVVVKHLWGSSWNCLGIIACFSAETSAIYLCSMPQANFFFVSFVGECFYVTVSACVDVTFITSAIRRFTYSWCRTAGCGRIYTRHARCLAWFLLALKISINRVVVPQCVAQFLRLLTNVIALFKHLSSK